MRILVVGSGGVGDAFARIAVQRDFFELLVMSDADEARAVADCRFSDGPTPGGGAPGCREGRRVIESVGGRAGT